MSDDRIVTLARIGCRDHSEVNASHRYSPELVADLKKALADYDHLTPHPVAAQAVTGIQRRNEKLEAAGQTPSQVRHLYCAASRQISKNPERLKIGFQPRRKTRSKEVIEAANKRKGTQRDERDAKRLQEIEEQEQQAVDRLNEAILKVRSQAAKDRESISGPAASPSTRESDGVTHAGDDVTLSS